MGVDVAPWAGGGGHGGGGGHQPVARPARLLRGDDLMPGSALMALRRPCEPVLGRLTQEAAARFLGTRDVSATSLLNIS